MSADDMSQPATARAGQYDGSRRQKLVKSLRAQADAQRRWSDRFADRITALTGSMPFLVVNVAWFGVWIIINLGWIPRVEPFDPFPFGLLTMIVSLEAIVLAITVLISQNRGASLDDLREEVHLQVNVLAERELTKIMEMVVRLLDKHDIDMSGDVELRAMLRPADVEDLERVIEEEMEEGGRVSGLFSDKD
jgi:uncharacterized membrane protein